VTVRDHPAHAGLAGAPAWPQGLAGFDRSTRVFGIRRSVAVRARCPRASRRQQVVAACCAARSTGVPRNAPDRWPAALPIGELPACGAPSRADHVRLGCSDARPRSGGLAAVGGPRSRRARVTLQRQRADARELHWRPESAGGAAEHGCDGRAAADSRQRRGRRRGRGSSEAAAAPRPRFRGSACGGSAGGRQRGVGCAWHDGVPRHPETPEPATRPRQAPTAGPRPTTSLGDLPQCEEPPERCRAGQSAVHPRRNLIQGRRAGIKAWQGIQNRLGITLQHPTDRQRQGSGEGGVVQFFEPVAFQQFELAHGHLQGRGQRGRCACRCARAQPLAAARRQAPDLRSWSPPGSFIEAAPLVHQGLGRLGKRSPAAAGPTNAWPPRHPGGAPPGGQPKRLWRGELPTEMDAPNIEAGSLVFPRRSSRSTRVEAGHGVGRVQFVSPAQLRASASGHFCPRARQIPWADPVAS
jgi:hypothetical protein